MFSFIRPCPPLKRGVAVMQTAGTRTIATLNSLHSAGRLSPQLIYSFTLLRVKLFFLQLFYISLSLQFFTFHKCNAVWNDGSWLRNNLQVIEDSFLRFGAQVPLALQEKPWEVVDLSQKLGVMEERAIRAWTSVWAMEEGVPEN